jgi:hypothetical protein
MWVTNPRACNTRSLAEEKHEDRQQHCNDKVQRQRQATNCNTVATQTADAEQKHSLPTHTDTPTTRVRTKASTVQITYCHMHPDGRRLADRDAYLGARVLGNQSERRAVGKLLPITETGLLQQQCSDLKVPQGPCTHLTRDCVRFMGGWGLCCPPVDQRMEHVPWGGANNRRHYMAMTCLASDAGHRSEGQLP